MRLLDVWLMAAMTMTCVCDKFFMVTTTYGQMSKMILELLAKDSEYKLLLTERVKLPVESVPEWLRYVFTDLDNVYPMHALINLNQLENGLYSRNKLDMSLLVLNTAITCCLYKRIAVHMMLTTWMSQLEKEKLNDKNPDFIAAMLQDMPSRSVDEQKQFISMFTSDKPKKSSQDVAGQETAVDCVEQDFTKSLKWTTDIVKSSCKVSEMNDYFAEFKLLDEAQWPYTIVDNNIVADNVPESEVSAMLTKNKEAIKTIQKMIEPFFNISLSTWQRILKLSADNKTDG